MSDYVIVDGDQLKFDPQFGANTVTVTGLAQISGTGEATIDNKNVCILGDEKKVSVSATYISSAYPQSGSGTLTIASLAADQQAPFVMAQTPVIVVGSQFIALFTVQTPATNPNTGPDPTPMASGSGSFTNSQLFVTAG
ncbi:hypothetical protein EDF81_0778 [Enterobacter sp. BIGb0383]|uniref:hypothetical protein n=1 Tax=unclassified Enterobacter TaxID=2608935 RepID=UPI000F4A4DE5|nr:MULTISPECIES: hypothetical protein [unclassified Enterobacter]ROP62293.1 hypothetical protein EDF81_0778 [Enterobacter sp. BIGb0383]ROS12454.1 hypothetical protein EC848_0780 [Enterobacter sp. BIGb0359]